MNAHTVHASTIVDSIVRGWRAAPCVTVVHNPDELPIPAPSDARGLYHRGGTWVVASTQSRARVVQTLAHEVVGHHAMRDMLGRKWRGFMHAISDGAARGDQNLIDFREHVRDAYCDNNGACTLSRVAMADEIAAALVEARFDGKTGRLAIANPARKMAMAAAGHLSREVLYTDRPVSIEELEGAILAAEHRLRHGGLFYGFGRRLRDWYASATMTRPWNPKERPMSLAESERLLRAENSRLKQKENARGGWDGIVFLACIVAMPFAIFAMASGILDFLRSIFH